MHTHRDESPIHTHTHTEHNHLLTEAPPVEGKYDYYRVPANLEEAKRHGLAKKVYVDGERDKELCLCCGFQVGEQIPLKANVEQMFHLGVGYPTYFEFIRHSINLLIVMFALSGLYSIISNVVAGDCSSESETNAGDYCVKGYILSFTVTNKRDSEDLLTAQMALNLFTIIAVMFLLHYVRLKLRQINFKADSQMVTSSDYTIEVQNVPIEATEKDIREWVLSLEERCGKLEVEKIVRPYAINQYIELTNQKSALKIHLAELNKVQNKKNLEKKLKIEEKMAEIAKKIQDLREPGVLKKCSVIYITFNTAQQAESVRSFGRSIKDFVKETFFKPKDSAKYLFQKNKVQVRRAPEPVDILWKNLEYTEKEKRKVRMFSLGITAIVLAVSFGLILLINWGQGEYRKSNPQNTSVVQILSIIASLIIVVSNVVLGTIIEFIAQYEKHETFTRYLTGITQKMAIAQFLNTAIVNLVSQIILAQTDVALTGSVSSRLQSLNFYGQGGLLENMFWVFITNALVGPSLTYFDPMFYWKKFNQHLAEKKGDQNKLTQMQANILYEGPNLDMPKKYAGLIKVVLLTTFYASAIPFAYIFTIIGLVAWVWADKYALLRRFALPQPINSELTDSMLEYLEWSTVTFAVGNLIFFYTLKNSENDFAFSQNCAALVWVTFGLSVFYVFFPMASLNAKLFPDIEKAAETECFSEAQLKFHTDYEITNPLTRKKALRNHLKKKSDAASPNRRLETRQTEELLDFEALDDYAIKVEENKLKSTPNQNVENFPKAVHTALQQFMSLQSHTKEHETEHGEHPHSHAQNVDKMVRNVFKSFRHRKLRQAEAEQEQEQEQIKEEVQEVQGEELDDIKLEINQDLKSSGKLDVKDFAEKSDPRFRGRELNREIGSPFFPHN